MNIYLQRGYERSFGTFPLKGEQLHAALDTALDIGYRSIDTAQMYGNEKDIGECLSAVAITRNDLFITTKVHPENFTDKLFIPSVEKSLRDLRIDQIDILLLHWPPVGGQILSSLKLLEQAYKQKLALHIGVSNYTSTMMRSAASSINAPLIINQVEFHPLLNQNALLDASDETNIPLSSYCSVARGQISQYPVFEEIGKNYGKSSSQVALRWILQKGVSINSMSTKRKNIENNFNVMDFVLSSIDMNRIEVMTSLNHRLIDKDLVPWAPNWD